MKTVGIRHLKSRMSEVLREVQDGETIEVTNHGRIVAVLVPPRRRLKSEEIDAALDSVDSLVARIGAHWPEGVIALEAVREVRRDL